MNSSQQLKPDETIYDTRYVGVPCIAPDSIFQLDELKPEVEQRPPATDSDLIKPANGVGHVLVWRILNGPRGAAVRYMLTSSTEFLTTKGKSQIAPYYLEPDDLSPHIRNALEILAGEQQSNTQVSGTAGIQSNDVYIVVKELEIVPPRVPSGATMLPLSVLRAMAPPGSTREAYVKVTVDPSGGYVAEAINGQFDGHLRNLRPVNGSIHLQPSQVPYYVKQALQLLSY